MKGQLFIRCNATLPGENISGYPPMCGFNIYPVYCGKKLKAEYETLSQKDRPAVVSENPKTVEREN